MSFAYMIIFLMIMATIAYKAGHSLDPKGRGKQNGQTTSGNTYTYQTGGAATQGRQQPMPTAPGQIGRQTSTVQNRAQTSQPQNKMQTPRKETVAAPETEEQSVTEYLREKAAQDEAEHRREKLQKQAEERRCHGHLNVARQLELGAPIPQNQRMAVCPYCAAENLIPIRDNSKYYCYFCHHELK